MKRYAVTAFIHSGKKIIHKNALKAIKYTCLKKYDTQVKSKLTTISPSSNLNTYPLANLPIFLTLSTTGLEFLPSAKLGPLLKKCNPEIKGTFTIVDCRTLTEEGKTGCRIISIEGSPEFMEYLATVPKQQQFKILHKKIYLNGGKRSDSVSEYTALKLTHAASAQFVKGVNDLIMKSASKMYGSARTQTDRQNEYINIETNSYKPNNNTLSTLSNIGLTMDPNSGPDASSMDVDPQPELGDQDRDRDKHHNTRETAGQRQTRKKEDSQRKEIKKASKI